MSGTSLQHKIEQLFSPADIQLNGTRPWDIRVHNTNFYAKVLAHGSLGFGESYMDCWWDCDHLDELVFRSFQGDIPRIVKSWKNCKDVILAKLFNRQSIFRATQVGKQHYDLGNDLYMAMLDKRMIYSCGYWKDASDLDSAQENKLHLVARKLHLKPGMKILDIGCGWGGTARFLAEHYAVKVTGVTISEKQVEFARQKDQGLPVDIRLQDYRSLSGQYDRILSLGMFEHVGYKNYRTFIKKVRSLLVDDGLFLLHTIGTNCSVSCTNPWLERYIFPNSVLPSVKQISKAFESVFILEDWHSFGLYYDKTLMQWFTNFDKNWPELKKQYGKRFYRMWKFYLLSCAGTFRARKNQLWQIVLSPKGLNQVYHAPR